MSFDLDGEPENTPPAQPEPVQVTAPDVPAYTDYHEPEPLPETPPAPQHDDAPTILDDVPAVAPAPADAPAIAPLPQGMAERPVIATMKKRYDGHTPVNDQIREDWMKMIDQDPQRFEALLYRPVNPPPTAPDEDGIETPLYTEINNNQVALDYHDPVMVNVLDCPDQRETFTAVDDDSDQDGLADDFLIIKASTKGIAIGSIFEWLEEGMDGGSVRRFWYVLRIYSLGTQLVGSLYYCIPARNVEGSAEVVKNVQQ
jgi:hypothetical protein